MKTDSKIREGFHSIEILLKNKPEVIKKVLERHELRERVNSLIGEDV